MTERDPLPYRPTVMPPLKCAVCGRYADRLTPEVSDPPAEAVGNGIWISTGPHLMGWTVEPCGHYVSGALYSLDVTTTPPASARFVYLHTPPGSSSAPPGAV